MLVHLHVKNLALIDEVEVDFSNHLNILTGETGAGKSIIIDSINSALGAKTSKSIIRTGCDYALIELLFYIHDEEKIKWIQSLDIPIDDSGELLITRKINNQGRSVQKVNGQSVTSLMVKEIAGDLIDIHGQHEHQSLLNKSKHLEILDQFCDDSMETLKDALKIEVNKYQMLTKTINDKLSDKEERQREIAFLEFECDEIERAQLEPHEDEALEKDYKRLSNSRRITEILSSIYALTCEAEGQLTASDAIGRASKLIRDIEKYDDALVDISKELGNLDNLLNDLNREISNYMSEMTFDAGAFQEIEERLNLINQLKMKYGDTIQEILDYYDANQKKLEELYNYETYRAELMKEKEATKEVIHNLCEQISKLRKEKASLLSKKIQSALEDLNFLEVVFEIKIEQLPNFNQKGWDDVEFMISTNPGEKIKPLHKVASGGELSRIMLAIKSILASTDAIETLIFDEIDVGISGRTAQKVSEKLALIAKEHQVICITHLPQIAAMADGHYMIEKNTDQYKTNTKIYPLKESQMVEEIARLLGGVKITDTVLHSAKEMKELANRVKKEFK